jgi:hypothetical protein
VKRYNFCFPPDLMEELRAIAVSRKTTLSELVRQVLIKYADGRRVPTDRDSTTA